MSCMSWLWLMLPRRLCRPPSPLHEERTGDIQHQNGTQMFSGSIFQAIAFRHSGCVSICYLPEQTDRVLHCRRCQERRAWAGCWGTHSLYGSSPHPCRSSAPEIRNIKRREVSSSSWVAIHYWWELKKNLFTHKSTVCLFGCFPTLSIDTTVC